MRIDMECIYIAVLLTCHNRKEKTISCLKSLFVSQDDYNRKHNNQLLLTVFLVDDGCTDGTSDEIKQTFINKMDVISIIKGDGSLYWAGGMRLAWRSSLEVKKDWDFYMLINDDTILNVQCIECLLKTHIYSLNNYGRGGIYCGVTCELGHPDRISYGGVVWTCKALARGRKILEPIGTPQECDATNANILLVSSEVYNELGILFEGYSHGYADYDYSMKAKKKGFPLLLSTKILGECNNDHFSIRNIILSMSFAERRRFFNSPLRSTRDHLLFYRRNFPLRYPSVLLGRLMWIFFPRLYYRLQDIRKVRS